MTPAIALTGVRKRYDDFALHDIDLTLPRGQVMGLVGVNGAGKSSLLRMLMGLVRADGGEVEVLGQRLPQAQVAVKRQIGYASDDMRLYRGQTLRWHMDFIRSVYPEWDEPYAQTLLKRFDLRPQQALRGFSHGQRVKALLLLIFARHPRLLLLDEPTTGLDPVARGEVLDAIAEVLRDEERSILFSSHNTADIEQIADSITFLHAGKVIASRDKETFLDNWRRIVCRGAVTDALRMLPGMASIRDSAPMVELKTGAFDDSTLPALQALGLSVESEEPMPLEDIFVTTVRGSHNA
ncbi:ABC transporter ATP-binding protein [Thermomonas carbonis]|uniref:ABC transporter ATP-binding protein n=1 Tax=Thermomonas carbonis TaxID=1463158 RepID=A0A7G9SSR2_9GAMM|nr:ABC transporter ATP-binding protein [Thermomonas carbonis]QNN70887.1 ABC transporter ATP-binding protein [Thermomonas carbonis]GHC03110.1 ABC transporter [Thermomonas carbonis]